MALHTWSRLAFLTTNSLGFLNNFKTVSGCITRCKTDLRASWLPEPMPTLRHQLSYLRSVLCSAKYCWHSYEASTGALSKSMSFYHRVILIYNSEIFVLLFLEQEKYDWLCSNNMFDKLEFTPLSAFKRRVLRVMKFDLIE